MWRGIFLGIIGSVLVGCGGGGELAMSPEEADAYLADKPPEMQPLLRKMLMDRQENRAMHEMRAGVVAMDYGHYGLAAELLDGALASVEAIYGQDDRARQARSLFSAEDRKVFRGEPYERAMAYYYRGILYLMEKDYENARASFRSGSLQDSMAASEEYQQDFALLDYLDGWASQCAGNPALAAESYGFARERNTGLREPGPADNLLVLADLGHAPVKYADGEHGEFLKIRAPEMRVRGTVRVELGAGGVQGLPNSESILQQATTRGGREFDHVLANKVVFKEDAAAAAEGAAMVSAVATGVSGGFAGAGDYDSAVTSAGIGLLAGLFSIAADAASAATEAAADTRQWDNLPEQVAYGSYRLDDPGALVEVRLEGGSFSSRPSHAGGDGACGVVWARSQPGLVVRGAS